jgi:endonuclease VIII
MPEGDSLHRVARLLGPKLIGERLEGLTLARSAADTKGVIGSLVTGVEAQGKNLLIHLQALYSLHIHLKMSGRVRLFRRADAPPIVQSNVSLILDTAQHRLVVVGAPVSRLLRTQDLPRDFHLRGLGPDLLGEGFDLAGACGRLAARRDMPLGEAMMDQGVIAGIGNFWKSELCFTLRLDPFAPVAAHSEAELSSLLSLARTQMMESVHRPKRTIPDPFESSTYRKSRVDRRQGEGPVSVYGRQGKPCYDCGTPIRMQRQGAHRRSTYYCPRCQPSRGTP